MKSDDQIRLLIIEPNLDDLAIVRVALQIRQPSWQEVAPQTPVIFLTGYKERYAAAAWELGAFGILDKPVDLNLLFETVQAAAGSPTH